MISILSSLFKTRQDLRAETLTKKCEIELEVKYTKLLTREFCIAWAKSHLVKDGQQASLIVCKSQVSNSRFDAQVYELRLDLIEKDILTGDARSIICCLIYAMDVEISLKQDLAAGNGACIFTQNQQQQNI